MGLHDTDAVQPHLLLVPGGVRLPATGDRHSLLLLDRLHAHHFARPGNDDDGVQFRFAESQVQQNEVSGAEKGENCAVDARTPPTMSHLA